MITVPVLILLGWALYMSGHCLTFDDLMDLKFLPGRRHPKPMPGDLVDPKDHAGVCLLLGQINSPFTGHHCDCTGYKFDMMYYGQPLCECGDEKIKHRRKR